MSACHFHSRKRSKRRRVLARDIMSPDPVCVTADTTVADCARLMRDRAIGCLPVLDADRQVIGIVSERDLFRAKSQGDLPAGRRWIELLGTPAAAAGALSEAASRRAGDVMTNRVICVRAEIPMEEVAAVLEQWNIKRAPVMADGRIVGIVSRSDVMRSLAVGNGARGFVAASDHAIRDRVVAQVEELTWLTGGAGVEVSVDDGNVVLYGFAASQEEAVAIEYLAEAIPGVRCVENYLRVGQNTKYRN